ncbi:MAG: hypothetical protein AAFR59_19370 [Bacteroidota bacterium]
MDSPLFTHQREMLDMANQVFDLARRIQKMEEGHKLQRNLRRMKEALESMGIIIHDPLGETWEETRTDCEATISGDSSERLVIQEVIKPIIRKREHNMLQIIQRGVVIVGTQA